VYADWFGKLASGFFSLSVALTLGKYFIPMIGTLHLDVIVFAVAIVLALVALVHYAKLNLFPTLRSEKK